MMRYILFLSFLLSFWHGIVFSQTTFSNHYDYFGIGGTDRGTNITALNDGLIISSLSRCEPNSCHRTWVLDEEGEAIWTYEEIFIVANDSTRCNPIDYVSAFVEGDSYSLFMTCTSFVSDSVFSTLRTISNGGNTSEILISDPNEIVHIMFWDKTPTGYITFSQRQRNDSVFMYTRTFNDDDVLLSEKTHDESPYWYNVGGNIVALGDTGYLYLNTYLGETNRFETLWGRRDAQGEIIWEHQNPPPPTTSTAGTTPGEDRYSNIMLTTQNKVIVTEYVDEEDYEDDPRTDITGDYIVHCYNLDGLKEWEQVLTYQPFYDIRSITPAANGDIIGVGQKVVQEYIDIGDEWYFPAWMFRMSPDGEILWERYFHSTEEPFMERWLEDVVELDDGRIAATGLYWDFNNPQGLPNADAWLLVVDENGCLEPDCEEQLLVSTDGWYWLRLRLCVLRLTPQVIKSPFV